MTPEEKLTLFEKYDFSKTGLLKRTALEDNDPQKKLYHDIGGIVQALAIVFAAVADGTAQDINEYNKLQDEIYKCYGWLNLKYQGIAWNELDAEDPDFSVFFRMKQSINDLGYSINSFLDQSRNRLGGRTDSREYENLQKQIQKIGKLMQQFRKAKEKLREQVSGR